MQERIESESVQWFDELATPFVRAEARAPVRPEVAREPELVSIPTTGGSDLVAQPRRRRGSRAERAPSGISPLALVLAAIAGASVFILAVAIASLA